MHDPKTVAHEIFGPRGWLHKRRRDKSDSYDWNDPRFSYLGPVVVVWHADPESDGSDDSCGYTYPRTPEPLREKAERIAESEWKFMFGEYPYRYQSASAYEILFALWRILAWRLFKRDTLTLGEMQEIADLASNPSDNLRAVIFDATRSEKNARRLGSLVLRCYLRTNRKWYQHPKWHLHHWQIQVPFIRDLKRLLFSRCCKCGQRFGWRVSPVTHNWNNEGPRWFRSERDVYHNNCKEPRKRAEAAAA